MSAKLHGAAFDLDSTALEWLVVTVDRTVAVKGTGTLQRRARLRLRRVRRRHAGRRAAGGLAVVRRHYPQETLVYDNRGQAGYDLDVSDPQPLGGGSLQVHQ